MLCPELVILHRSTENVNTSSKSSVFFNLRLQIKGKSEDNAVNEINKILVLFYMTVKQC